MTITISDSNVIPVTREQKETFATWVKERYTSYDAYVNGSVSYAGGKLEIDEYIRTHIFSEDMKAVWRESCELEMRVVDELYIKRIKLYRARLLKKIRYMKQKLGKLVFSDELSAYYRRIQEERDKRYTRMLDDYNIPRVPAIPAIPAIPMIPAVPMIPAIPAVPAVRYIKISLILNFANVPPLRVSILATYSLLNGCEYTSEAIEAVKNEIRIYVPLISETELSDRLVRIQRKLSKGVFPRIKNIECITETQANLDMKDSCAICMEVQKMIDVCTTRCGHQFGVKCLSAWKENTCPMCREKCTEVTEYKVSAVV